MSKTSNCSLVQYTKDRSSVALAGTNKSTKAELPYFILAILIMARNMRFIGGVLLLLTSIYASPANAYQLEVISGHSPPRPFTLIFLVPRGYGMIPLRQLCPIGVHIPYSNIKSSVGYMRILAIRLKVEME